MRSTFLFSSEKKSHLTSKQSNSLKKGVHIRFIILGGGYALNLSGGCKGTAAPLYLPLLSIAYKKFKICFIICKISLFILFLTHSVESKNLVFKAQKPYSSSCQSHLEKMKGSALYFLYVLKVFLQYQLLLRQFLNRVLWVEQGKGPSAAPHVQLCPCEENLCTKLKGGVGGGWSKKRSLGNTKMNFFH